MAWNGKSREAFGNRWLRRAFGIAAGLLALHGARAVPAAAQQPQGKAWAVLVGVQDYDHEQIPDLPFIDNDVNRLTETLRERAGYNDREILKVLDGESEQKRPTRDNVLAALREQLESVGPDDRILIYFTGHGLKDDQGRLYLAPRDCDLANLAGTCIPAADVRQMIEKCPARLKLLILDTCHAGGKAVPEPPSGDLGAAFEGLQKVAILASCTADQESGFWQAKQQSLFSYWLVQGLKGHADQDGDAQIKIDELYHYVFKNVLETSERLGGRVQTPLRFTGEIPGDPVIARLRPLKLAELVDDIAEQFSVALEQGKLLQVAVPEFAGESTQGGLLGGHFGTLGVHCQSELQRSLNERAPSIGYTVPPHQEFQTALKALDFQPDDLGDPSKLQQLSSRLGGLPVLAVGRLVKRSGSLVTLRAELVTTNGELVAQAAGIARLTEDEAGLLGISSKDLKPAGRRRIVETVQKDLAADDGPGPEVSESAMNVALEPEAELAVVDAIVIANDLEASAGHPLQDDEYPFKVRILARHRDSEGKAVKENGNFVMEERPRQFEGNRMLVGLKYGDVYSVSVDNTTDETVVLRLLVDGLNSLPIFRRPEETVPLDDGWGQPVALSDLDKVRGWVLEPGKRYSISGFVTKTGEEGEWLPFTMAEGGISLARQRGFGDQLGTITLAFYSVAPPSVRGPPTAIPGTVPGRPENVRLIEKNTTAGDHRSTITIHYVDLKDLSVQKSIPVNRDKSKPKSPSKGTSKKGKAKRGK